MMAYNSQNKAFEENGNNPLIFEKIFSQNIRPDYVFDVTPILHPLSPDMKIYSVLRQFGLSSEVINRISLYQTHKNLTQFIQKNYISAKHEHFWEMNNISFVDFKLASVASVLGLTAISLDAHILCDLPKILKYESLWPQDIAVFNRTGPFLLDANIVLSLSSKTMTDHKGETLAMFNTQNIQFILMDELANEIIRVLRKWDLEALGKKETEGKIKKQPICLGEDDFQYESAKYIRNQIKNSKRRSDTYRTGFNMVYPY